MHWLLSASLLALWLYAMVIGNPFGPSVHLLLAAALVAICWSLGRGSPAESL
jgi:hypothetical protein